MPNSELLRHWLHTTDDPLSVFSLVLVLFMSATLGAVLASLVTWAEEDLILAKRAQTRSIQTRCPSNPDDWDRRPSNPKSEVNCSATQRDPSQAGII
jgi:hypothetical protein